MKPIADWENVKEADGFARPAAGGFLVEIVKVEDDPANEKLIIQYDIINGEFANYYRERFTRMGYELPKEYRSYKTKAASFFKAFTSMIEKCNPGYKWNWSEQSLVGKTFGAVFRDEEYIGNDGNVKVRTRIHKLYTCDDILAGNFKVPELKKLEQGAQPVTYGQIAAAGPAPVPYADEIPF